MRKQMRLVAALAMGVSLLTGLLPGTAHAAPKATVATVVDVEPLAAHSCDPGDFCAYEVVNFTFSLYAWAGNDSNWSNNFTASGISINNNDSSWRNRSNPCVGCDAVRVFDNTNYGAPVTVCLTRGQSLASWGPANNRGSSHSWYGGC